jgi:hypothetical protein
LIPPESSPLSLSILNAFQKLAERQFEGGGQRSQMAKPNLTDTPFKIRNVNLMDSRVLRQVDLSPASFLAELSNSLAKLEADIRWHPTSIDLVEALYLADALSALTERQSGGVEHRAINVVSIQQRATHGRTFPLNDKTDRIPPDKNRFRL